MKKAGVSKWVILSLVIFLVVLILIVSGLVFYLLLGSADYTGVYEDRIVSGEIVNPVIGLSDDEAVLKFDESFVYYLLVNIKAYNLHEAMFSDEIPRIEFYIDDVSYNAEIADGEIDVEVGEINGEDIIIRTSALEGVKMIRDENYISDSFSSGASGIELVADKSTLFAKGYLKIYSELTGGDITGDVISRFFD